MCFLLMDILNISREITSCKEAYLSENFITLFIKYDKDLINEIKDIDYACAYQVNPTVYIVSVQVGRYTEFIRRFSNILDIDVSFPYTLSAIEPVNAANITQFHGEGFYWFYCG